MIDYDKISQYEATMAMNLVSGANLIGIAISDLIGDETRCISENDLHNGIEYLIAKQKKEIEENQKLSTTQKNIAKEQDEYQLKTLEEWIKSYLKNKNRLQ